jgi:hypothetical protein
MDRLRELLARLGSLSDDELEELRRLVLQLANADKGNSDKVYGVEDNEQLAILASAADAYRSERERRDLEAQQRHADEQTLAQFVSDAMTVPAGRGPASGPSAGSVTALTALGRPVQHASELSAELIDAMHSMGMTAGADGDRVKVGKVRWSRPADRTLADEHPERVAELLAAAAEQHAEQIARTLAEQPEAMTAAGGYGAVRQPLYDLPGFESRARPVRAALPGLTVTRGGVTFTRPPTLATLDGATSIWTVANDVAAVTNAAVRKPALRVQPGPAVSVDLQAVVSQLVFGNLLSRANPEHVRRVLDLAQAHAAAIAEQQLLTQMGALSTPVTVGASPLGATRQLLPVLERAAAAIRNRGRMAPGSPLQVFLPSWTRSLMRADLTAQMPGDAILGVTDAELSRYLSARGLAVTWTLDGEAGQRFGDQAADAGLVDFPTHVVAYVFPAGAFVFADGGVLDLGIVRDSVLNSGNDHMVFSESFEAVLHRAGEALRLSVPVSPTGVSRGTAAANAL